MARKVCILTTVHFYNDNRVYYKEVQSLQRLGYDVTYVAPNINGATLPHIKHIEIKKETSTIKRMLGFIHAFHTVRKLGCEVVHFQDTELIPAGLLLKLFTRIKVIYDVHEDYPSQMLTKFYLPKFVRHPMSWLMRFLEWISGKTFDAIVVADHNVYKHFPAHKTIILYNYPSVRLLRESTAKLGIIEKEYDIIFPGSMAKFTAQLFLDVLKETKNRNRPIRCLLISPFHFPGGKNWVLETAKKYGVSEQLTLLDRIPPYEVPKYLKSARIGLIPLPDTPKMRANIPTKMFEYMYMELPVLTGDLPPCAYYMNRDKFGYLLTVDSVKDYTNHILYLLDHPEEIESMGKCGHELVENKYNWEHEESKLKELYEKILK